MKNAINSLNSKQYEQSLNYSTVIAQGDGKNEEKEITKSSSPSNSTHVLFKLKQINESGDTQQRVEQLRQVQQRERSAKLGRTVVDRNVTSKAIKFNLRKNQ